MPDKIFFIEKRPPLIAPRSIGGLIIAVAAIMPHGRERSKRGALPRYDWHTCFPQSGMVECRKMSQLRHCERSEAIQTVSTERFWVASLRSK
ncbi:hypothetical protein [Bradyrhizobium sp. LTSP857]|uniref:hypothetical protein n=1 Tax=Bradyrhizobium sp. LTSP857 TaxID=1619231 RepID=UPI0018CE4CD3|nr:hypothetical protein [Bradyrhizobium sp. LTSP857]